MHKLLSLSILLLAAAVALAFFCPYCGQEVAEGFKFCPRCGKSLEHAGELVGKEGQPDGGQDVRANEVARKDAWGRYPAPTKKEVEEFLAGEDRLVVDFANIELITGKQTYYLFQLDMLEEMYGRPVPGKADHKNSHGQDYMVYRVANIQVDRYKHLQVGKWQAVPPVEGESGYEVMTLEGIRLGQHVEEVRDRMRWNQAYVFERDKTKKKQRILIYKKERRFATDYQVEFYFSPGESKLVKIRFGLLKIK